MIKFRFPQSFRHTNTQVQNVNEIIDSQLTFGQKASDWVATNLGSWWFIILQTVILMIWVVTNVLSWYHHDESKSAVGARLAGGA